MHGTAFLLGVTLPHIHRIGFHIHIITNAFPLILYHHLLLSDILLHIHNKLIILKVITHILHIAQATIGTSVTMTITMHLSLLNRLGSLSPNQMLLDFNILLDLDITAFIMHLHFEIDTVLELLIRQIESSQYGVNDFLGYEVVLCYNAFSVVYTIESNLEDEVLLIPFLYVIEAYLSLGLLIPTEQYTIGLFEPDLREGFAWSKLNIDEGILAYNRAKPTEVIGKRVCDLFYIVYIMEPATVQTSDLVHQLGIVVVTIAKSVDIVRVILELLRPFLEILLNNRTSLIEVLIVLSIGKEDDPCNLVLTLSR